MAKKPKYKKLLKGTHDVQTQLVNQRVDSSWVASVGIALLADDRLVLSVEFRNGKLVCAGCLEDGDIDDYDGDGIITELEPENRYFCDRCKEEIAE